MIYLLFTLENDNYIFQLSGFAILIDRRNGSWQELSAVFYKIVSLFPANIKEVFLLYKYPAGVKCFIIFSANN